MNENIEYDAVQSSNVDQKEYNASSYDVVQKYDESSYPDVFQQDVDTRNILSKYLSHLHFQYKVIEFVNDFIYKYYANTKRKMNKIVK